jgi:hypothetical protein
MAFALFFLLEEFLVEEAFVDVADWAEVVEFALAELVMVAVLPSLSPPSMACVSMLVLWKYTLLVFVHGFVAVPLNRALLLDSEVSLVTEPVQVSE